MLTCLLFCLTESVCVPILRSDDNCSFPKVGVPQSPSLLPSYDDVVDVGSPDEPRYKVRAYAGPMSPQEVCTTCTYDSWRKFFDETSRIVTGLQKHVKIRLEFCLPVDKKSFIWPPKNGEFKVRSM